LAFIENELNRSDALDIGPSKSDWVGCCPEVTDEGAHFIPLYRRSSRWMGGKWLRCSFVPHDCLGSCLIMDESGIRFSFLSDIDQAGSNFEVGGKDRSDEEGHGNERANEPSGDHVFLGHGVGSRMVPHCALHATEQTNPQRIRSRIFRMTRPRGGGSAPQKFFAITIGHQTCPSLGGSFPSRPTATFDYSECRVTRTSAEQGWRSPTSCDWSGRIDVGATDIVVPLEEHGRNRVAREWPSRRHGRDLRWNKFCRCRSVRPPTRTHEQWRNAMSYEPADHSVALPQIAASELIGLGGQFPPANNQGLKKLISVLIIASAVSACTGGAGLDIPMKAVDHGCHTFDLEGGASGCS
jgi:hypothetical protein